MTKAMDKVQWTETCSAP